MRDARYSESRFRTNWRIVVSQTAPTPAAAPAAEPGGTSAGPGGRPPGTPRWPTARFLRHRAGAPSGRQVTAIVGVLALAVFMSSLDLFIVNLAFPYIGKEFPGTSLGSLSWVLNAYTIVFAAVLVPAGRWADRIGRRLVFTLGLIGFTVGSLLCGLAPGVQELIGARIVQAAGAG